MSEEDDAERVASGRRATSHLGFLAHPFVPFLGGIVGAAGAICMVIGLVEHEEELAVFGGFDVVMAGGACVLAWLVGRKSLERTIARELDWLEDLPFTIDKPFMLLGSDHATIAVTFRSDHPTVEQWETMLKSAGGPVLVFEHRKQEGRVFEVWGRSPLSWPGGHRLWRAWHDLIERTLVPLHARHAIESVRVVR